MDNLTEENLKILIEKVVTEKLAQNIANPAHMAGSRCPSPTSPTRKKVAIGSDHGGYKLKEQLSKHICELGYDPIDCGTSDTNAVDYPDFARLVAVQVASGSAWRGVMIDGAGIGSCMTANKVPGIRASMCYDLSSASNAREHNDANVLTLGAGLIGENLAKQILKTWLSTEFGGGRHQPRIEKITSIEKEYLK